MAQTLDHNNSITTVVPVEIPLFEDDLVIIQKLDDEPNDVGGLTAAELKAEFDKGNLTAQAYINQTLIPRIVADDLTEQARQAAESERVSNEIERVSNENARIQAEAAREAKVYEKFPYVGENGNWQEWDESAGAFVDSGVQAQGERGTGILKVITEPKEVTGTVWLWFSRSKVLSESGASEVLVGDIIQHESNHYLVDEVTSSNVYIRTVPTSIKGDAFVYEDFTEEQLNTLSQSIAKDVLNAANLCYVAVAVPASDVGKDGDVCVVLE